LVVTSALASQIQDLSSFSDFLEVLAMLITNLTYLWIFFVRNDAMNEEITYIEKLFQKTFLV
jgi:hypothetical protein